MLSHFYPIESRGRCLALRAPQNSAVKAPQESFDGSHLDIAERGVSLINQDDARACQPGTKETEDKTARNGDAAISIKHDMVETGR